MKPQKPLESIPTNNGQRRIIAKVDEMVAICDRLEAQLIIAQTEGRQLLEGLLHEALVRAA